MRKNGKGQSLQGVRVLGLSLTNESRIGMKFQNPRKGLFVVDSFCCDSNGGCCDARRCLLLHSLPVPEPELWPVLRQCQQ